MSGISGKTPSITLTSPTGATTELQPEGEYSLPFRALRSSNQTPATASSAILEPMDMTSKELLVVNGKYFVQDKTGKERMMQVTVEKGQVYPFSRDSGVVSGAIRRHSVGAEDIRHIPAEEDSQGASSLPPSLQQRRNSSPPSIPSATHLLQKTPTSTEAETSPAQSQQAQARPESPVDTQTIQQGTVKDRVAQFEAGQTQKKDDKS